MNTLILKIKNLVRHCLGEVQWQWMKALNGKDVASAQTPETFMQRRLYFLVVVAVVLICCFLFFLGVQYYEFQSLHNRMYRIQELFDHMSETNLSLRTSARLGAATTEPRWEILHQEKESEMDATILQLITICSEATQDNLGFELQVQNVQLLEIENRAYYMVRDGRTDFSEAAALLDNPSFEEKRQTFETTMDNAEKKMIDYLQNRIVYGRDRALVVSLALLCVSVIPLLPIMRILRLSKSISTEREIAERQLTRLNSCLLSFEGNSMINIQSLVDVCGDLLEADGVAYQRIEGETVCTVAWYGNVFCRPAELLKGSLAEFAQDNISIVPVYWNGNDNPEQLKKLEKLMDVNCRTYIGQMVRSQDEVIGVLHIFYRKLQVAVPQNLRFVTIVTSAIAPEERRLRAVETLRTSEASYRLMADNATDLIMRATLNGTIIYVSPACSKLLGFTSSDLLGTGLDRLWHPDDLQICWERAANSYLTLMEGITVHRLKNKTGDYLWFESVSRQVVNTEERWGREMILVSREISERKQAEDALQREREQLSITLRSIADGVISTDLDDRIVLMNRVAEQLTGWSHIEAQGKSLMEIFNVSPSNEFNDALNGKPISLSDVTLKPRNGDTISIEANCSPIKHFDESIIGHLVVFHDQTEKQRMQVQLALSSKLQSIGQLAAGIAHEINTPMQFISDNTEFIRKAYSDYLPLNQLRNQLEVECQKAGHFPELTKAIKSKCEEIDNDYLISEMPIAINETLSGIDRVTKLVKAMKTFSHPSQGKMQMSDLNQSIDATVNVSRNEWKYVADLELNLDATLPLVPCLIDELNQVILNMITNSVDAIKDGIASNRITKGCIKVSTKLVDREAHIIIKDNGNGMPEEVMKKIFDPFFTTKEPGRGTGQGLAISHDIITHKHSGRIDVQSEAGKGTQFTIILPLHEITET